MEYVKRILVVSKDTQYCRQAVQYGFSLARHYGAKFYTALENSAAIKDSIRIVNFI